MVSYDPSVIQELASRLYNKADWIVVRETALGTVFGLLAALLSNVVMQPVFRPISSVDRPDGPSVIVILFMVAGAVLGGLFGWMIGESKAFRFRLQAQLALCQVEIEMNTRTGR